MSAIPLSQLRGDHIGKARNSLPACRADSPKECTAGVETDAGLVCITFAKTRSQHHKTIRWFWVPASAELRDPTR
jgi:hypothetical protein